MRAEYLNVGDLGILLLLLLLLLCVCDISIGVHVTACIGRSKDNYGVGFIYTFMNSKDNSQDLGFIGQTLYAQSHLSSPRIYFYSEVCLILAYQ